MKTHCTIRGFLEAIAIILAMLTVLVVPNPAEAYVAKAISKHAHKNQLLNVSLNSARRINNVSY